LGGLSSRATFGFGWFHVAEIILATPPISTIHQGPYPVVNGLKILVWAEADI
jgi:hypothetical protein